PITAADVRNTVRLLRNPKWSGYNPAWGKLVQDPQVGGDFDRVTLPLSQGFFDPLSLMTFKVLPEHPFADGHPLGAGDDMRFGQQPVGSGPFQLQGRGQTNAGRPFVRFTANPTYASRAGKTDLPRINEIDFIETSDPVKDLQLGELDLVADLP